MLLPLLAISLHPSQLNTSLLSFYGRNYSQVTVIVTEIYINIFVYKKLNQVLVGWNSRFFLTNDSFHFEGSFHV